MTLAPSRIILGGGVMHQEQLLQESDAECGVCRVDLVINGKVPEQQGLF